MAPQQGKSILTFLKKKKKSTSQKAKHYKILTSKFNSKRPLVNGVPPQGTTGGTHLLLQAPESKDPRTRHSLFHVALPPNRLPEPDSVWKGNVE